MDPYASARSQIYTPCRSPGHNFQNAYTYDAASNRQSLTAPASIATYAYDTLNRLNGMANSSAGSFRFSYDALSRRTQLARPNKITTNYGSLFPPAERACIRRAAPLANIIPN